MHHLRRRAPKSSSRAHHRTRRCSETTAAIASSRVDQNDPYLTVLSVTNPGEFIPPRTGWVCYWPSDSTNLERLGCAIGNNNKLLSLSICSDLGDTVADGAGNDAFFDGLRRNDSIFHLDLKNTDLSENMGKEFLMRFITNNSNLRRVDFARCSLGSLGVLTSAVTSCTSLAYLSLAECNIDDDILERLISGIKGLNLHGIGLSRNTFGRDGCKALAALLEAPSNNLEWLDLERNSGIDDHCAGILAKSLATNHGLANLDLTGNGAITKSGWDAFSRILCNTASINKTYLSNHTLRHLGSVDLPTSISSLLKLNYLPEKGQVVITKIARSHKDLKMDHLLLQMDLKALPFVISWVDRNSRAIADTGGANPSNMRLSVMYQFATASPLVFISSIGETRKKRRTRDKLSSVYRAFKALPTKRPNRQKQSPRTCSMSEAH